MRTVECLMMVHDYMALLYRYLLGFTSCVPHYTGCLYRQGVRLKGFLAFSILSISIIMKV